MQRPTKGVIQHPPVPLRERLSLRSIMTWTNVVSILTASLIAGYYALTIIYQNKLSDTWAIMFLDLEHQGTNLAGRLAGIVAAARPPLEADSVLSLGEKGRIKVERGGLGADLTLADFNIQGDHLPVDLPAMTVLSFAGQAYLLRSPGGASGVPGQFVLRRVPPSTFEIRPAPPASQGALYLLTREGRLLYTSDASIVETTVVSRPLVQRFIAAPIKQGQMELTSQDGDDFYGFFAEIPGTNIVMFSEVAHSAAMAPLKKIVIRFLGVLVSILCGAVVLLQLPLSRITGPVRELAQLASAVGQGRFDVNPSVKGLGELSALTSAFSSMASGLVERDRKVALLMQEQAEKSRLEGELAIARRIQENLLPTGQLPRDSGLSIAAEYIPAAECAGDWYHYFYDPMRRETVVVIADVSGHGAGSSIFTAIIAGLFDDVRFRSDVRFDLLEFAKRANDVIFRLGQKQWHATMAIARFVAGEREIDLLLAGHPAPLIRTPGGDDRDGKKRPLPGSSPLGTSLDFKPLCKRLEFPKGASLLVYTDGLTEAVNESGRMFSRRRVRSKLLEGSDDPQDMLTELLSEWRAHLADRSPQDDVCVVAMRAV